MKQALKRMLLVALLMGDCLILGLALLLPFSNPIWFIGSFIVILLHYGFMPQMIQVVGKLMEEL